MSDDRPAETASQTPSTKEVATTPPLTVPSSELFSGKQEIQIQHGEEIYRLRITRNGKLILTK